MFLEKYLLAILIMGNIHSAFDSDAFSHTVSLLIFFPIFHPFHLEGETDSLYGPAKVIDLRVENFNQNELTANLVFTAPGGDLMDGRGMKANDTWVAHSMIFEDGLLPLLKIV